MVRRLIALLAVLLLVSNFATIPSVQADQLLGRYLKLADSRGSATTTYEFGFRFTNSDPLVTIVMELCSNNPFPGDACTVPAGLNVSTADLVEQSGNTGFSIAPQTTANRLVLQRNGSAANTVDSMYKFENVRNPTNTGSYFVRIQTYGTTQTTGGSDNFGGIAFAITRNISVTATVPPYLLFCVGVAVVGTDCNKVFGNYVNFGEFSTRQASQGVTQMLAATNAKDGYTIRVTGPTLTSGINTIPNLVGSDISRPGVSQFGMNLRANSSPQGGVDPTGAGNGLPTNGYSQINTYRFNSGDVVASSPLPDEARKYTTTYMVNISRLQMPGAYVSTLTYIALGSF